MANRRKTPRSETQQAFNRARWEAFAETRDPELREQLILQYTPLVKYVLGRVALHLPTVVDYDDMLSVGTIGLIEAIERFDPAHGVKFETYAIARIRGSIIDGLRSLDHLSRSVRTKAKQERAARVDLTFKLQRPPTDQEVAEAMGLTTEAYRSYLVNAAWTTTSLDTLGFNSDADEESMESLVVADPDAIDVDQALEQQDRYRELAAAIRTLPERDQRVLTLYYKDELTMREVSEVLGISESRVCQLHARALERLHDSLSEVAEERAA
jgi:RNA polymerase sigma factor for flagellar operon FliA